MFQRSLESFFGDGNQSAPHYDMSFFSANLLASIPKINWDGPAGSSTPGSLDGSEGVEQPFVVHLTAGVTYSFAERPTDTGGIVDPFLYLTDSSYNLLTYDDDGGAGRSSLLTFTPTTTGDYILWAGSWVNDYNGGGDVGNFNLFQWNSTQPDA